MLRILSFLYIIIVLVSGSKPAFVSTFYNKVNTDCPNFLKAVSNNDLATNPLYEVDSNGVVVGMKFDSNSCNADVYTPGQYNHMCTLDTDAVVQAIMAAMNLKRITAKDLQISIHYGFLPTLEHVYVENVGSETDIIFSNNENLKEVYVRDLPLLDRIIFGAPYASGLERIVIEDSSYLQMLEPLQNFPFLKVLSIKGSLSWTITDYEGIWDNLSGLTTYCMGNQCDKGSFFDFNTVSFLVPKPTSAVVTTTKACDNNPCKNGATCNDHPTNPSIYTCTCVNGYYGGNCDKDPCATNPCRNSGTCKREAQQWKNTNLRWTCECSGGYAGVVCQISPANNPCLTKNPCRNGGTCTNTIQNWAGHVLPFTCLCTSDWEGVVCHKSKNLCNTYGPAKTYCKNAGTCITDNYMGDNWYGCECKQDWGGRQCDESSYKVYASSFTAIIRNYFDSSTNNMKPLDQMAIINDFIHLPPGSIRHTMQTYIALLKKKDGIQKTWSSRKQRIFSYWVLSWTNNPNNSVKDITSVHFMEAIATYFDNNVYNTL
jgi:hypothetical protein